jgi:hypothetical protein
MKSDAHLSEARPPNHFNSRTARAAALQDAKERQALLVFAELRKREPRGGCNQINTE